MQMELRGTLRVTTFLLGVTSAIAAQVPNAGFGEYPQSPKAEPLTETVHGVSVSDPYRWMERPDRRDEMIAWIKASSAQTKETLGSLPGHGPLLKELESASRASESHSPRTGLVPTGREFPTPRGPRSPVRLFPPPNRCPQQSALRHHAGL